MVGKFIYSKFRLLFQKKTKYKFKTIIDKHSYFEGKNKISSGDFSGSYFGFGTISGSSLPNCKVGKYSAIGRDCHIIPAFHNYSNPSISQLFFKSELLKTENGYYVEIGNDVWIGSNVLIKGGVKIGDGAIIGMGSIVVKDVEPYTIIAGVPAKVIKKRFSDEQIARFINACWWDLDYKILSSVFNTKDINSFLDEIERLKQS